MSSAAVASTAGSGALARPCLPEYFPSSAHAVHLRWGLAVALHRQVGMAIAAAWHAARLSPVAAQARAQYRSARPSRIVDCAPPPRPVEHRPSARWTLPSARVKVPIGSA
eukprot:2312031-Prymnesium_polylepis.1